MALKEYHPEHFRVWFRRLGCLLLACLLSAGVIGGFYALSQVGSSRPSGKSAQAEEDEAKRPGKHALLRESQELVEQYDRIEHTRDVTVEDAGLLRRALELREEYFSGKDFVNIRDMQDTRELRKRLHDALARPLGEEARALAAQTEKLFDAGSTEEALAKIEEAVSIQHKINIEYNLSEEASVSHLTRYERRMRELTALPMYEESLAFEQQAREAIEREAWKQAQAALEKAAQRQRAIVSDFPGLRVADMPRLRRLEEELHAYASLDDYLLVEEQISLAEAAQSRGALEEAALHFEKARKLQSALNAEHPGSRFAKAERVESLRRRAETARSLDDAAPLIREVAKLKDVIRSRDASSIQASVAALAPELTRFRRAFPHSDALSQEDYALVDWLALLGEGLAPVLEQLEPRHFLPLESGEKKLFLTSVNQELFRAVSGANPSRERDAVRPVDSVNISGIERFCERLGWLAGQRVRLPSAQEWAASRERLEKAYMPDGAPMQEWAVSTDGELGWVDPEAQLQGFFSRKVPTERNRSVTFRFVLEPLAEEP